MEIYDLDLQQRLTESIEQFVLSSAHNSLGLGDEPAFDAPLIGFSNGADELYREYKNHIGSFYFTPREMFQAVFSLKQQSSLQCQPIGVHNSLYI